MLSEDDIFDALTKCSGYDPAKFSSPSDIVVDAWVEHFSDYPVLTREDLLAAVKVYYRTPDRKVPQPADISAIARDHRRTRPETDEEIDARNLANDERLGLETGWARALSAEQIASADQRRSVIEQFTQEVGHRNVITAAKQHETVAERVARIRAEGPPQPLPPEEDVKVSQDRTQTQDGVSGAK